VILVPRDCDHAMLRRMKLETASSLEEALEKAYQFTSPAAKVAVIPDGVSVISCVKE
jgi:nickel-dependent lactate racemase